MSDFRRTLEACFAQGGKGLWALWLAVPVLVLALPGVGVLAAGVWVVLVLWLGRQKPGVIGLRKPSPRDVGLALVLGALIWAVAAFGIDPGVAALTKTKPDLSAFEGLEGNPGMLAGMLALAWLSGALLEETVFRGFLVHLGAKLLGPNRGWPLAVFSAVLFGLMHYYQGLTGMLTTGIVGFIFGAVFLLTGRNLALVMIVHGFVDTIYFTLAFLGLKELS